MNASLLLRDPTARLTRRMPSVTCTVTVRHVLHAPVGGNTLVPREDTSFRESGVSCVSCHGKVNEMPVVWHDQPHSMAWCLDCHRDPSKYIRPRDEITTMGYRPAVSQRELGPRLVEEYKIGTVEHLTSCSVCHR